MVILTFIIRLTHANVWESMGKLCSCMQFIKSHIFYSKSRENPYQYCKSRENPYQVLQMRTRNNTDGNKLVIFSGIALYYDNIDDFTIIMVVCNEGGGTL